jgi:large subunit ribosomal protein L29
VKASEVRDLSKEEMLRKVDELKEELFNLRFQHEIGQLDNPQKMKEIKRNIARVKSIIKESERNSEED